MMRLVLLLFLLYFSELSFAQDNDFVVTGKVSYKTSKNIYIRFTSTELLNIGDTLSWKHSDEWIKSLVILQKSSSSCVVENLMDIHPEIGHEVIYFKSVILSIEPIEDIFEKPPLVELPTVVTLDEVSLIEQNPVKTSIKKESLFGRISLSTNASVNPSQDNIQRVRASVALNIQNIRQSNFSIQSYFTYRHRYGIDQSNTNFYDDFKILSLAVQYQPSDHFQVWIGRKNNPNVANLGVIDGLQGEYNFKKYTIGSFLGTRPDFTNFTFNANLPQIGLYIVRHDKFKSGTAHTSLAIAEQQNDFKTDRRFMYFQHNNQVIKNLQFFFSSEFDLFKKINGETSVKPQLTSLYTSLRYRLNRNLSFSGSYDNRRNVIYFESYQTFIDQLLAQETRQGFRFQVQWNLFKKLQFSTSSFFRFQGSNTKPTKNYTASVHMNRIVGKRLNVSLNVNQLESYYFKGNIIGGRIYDQFWKGKVQLELNYRNVHYTFFNTESTLRQHTTGMNVSWMIIKNTSLILSYENTSEPSRVWHRYFITISQRFKK